MMQQVTVKVKALRMRPHTPEERAKDPIQNLNPDLNALEKELKQLFLKHKLHHVRIKLQVKKKK